MRVISSQRVKGIAFHPKLTLLAASLHSGSIQVYVSLAYGKCEVWLICASADGTGKWAL